MKEAENMNMFKRLLECASQPLLLENWYTETFFSDFTMEYHTHPQIEIMYCVHGRFDFMYKYSENDNNSYSVTINQNCFILVNTGYYHKVTNMSQTTKIINLEFLPYCDSIKNYDIEAQPVKFFAIPLEELFPTCTELQKLIAKDKDYYIFVDSNNILSTMKEFIRQMTRKDPIDELTINMALLTNKLFIDMSHCVSPENHKKTGIMYVDSAMMYINTHFFKKITVAEIANYVNISSVYLQRLFQIQYGKTIHRVITDKRIMQAKHLLEQSNLSVEEIANQCGFGSREQLAYEFQKLEGKSPSKHRKEINVQKIRFFSHYGETKIKNDEQNQETE